MVRQVLALLFPLFIIGILEFTLIRSVYNYYEAITIDLYIYAFVAFTGYVGLLLALINFRKKPIERPGWLNFLIGFGPITMIQKIIFLILVIVATILSIIPINWPQFSFYTPLLLSLIPFGYMVYGMLFGKYKYELEEVELKFQDLPDAFEGFKIVHFSDAHSGTWDSIDGVSKGIDLMNMQNADVILFTGDLVNSSKNEIDPFIELFSSLKANFGKFAVLGNHDYYGQPMDRDQRPAYYDDFFEKYKAMGFDLVNNANRIIEKGGDRIRLLGVENWGVGRYFPKRGDIEAATRDVQPDEFKVLMSHDPTHWKEKVLDFSQRIHLTLSGHTHAMQFGINLPFWKWSPVKYRYKHWIGLYHEKNQYLYVNRGFGMLVYPGRAGMHPEVTVITLRKG